MVHGHWLLLLLLSHDLWGIIHAVDYAGSGLPRRFLRRSNPYFTFSNTSIFDDLMLDDEANAGGQDLQEKLVVRGQVVILECLEIDTTNKRKNKIKDTHSDAAARWYHDDKEVKPDLRVSWSVEGRLRISHVVSGDSGVWRCRKEGYFRRPLRLVVTIPPEPSYLVYGSAQLAQGARLTTRAGNALNLHCMVDGGNPAPTIAWFLNEREITSNSTVRNDWRGPDEQYASVSNVTIERVLKSHHNASVVCRVEHPALSRPHTSHLKLNIEYPPDFRLRRWPVWGSPLRQGASVSLLCNVDANPQSSPFWIKESDGEEVEVGSVEGWLNFTDVSTENRGWYKCVTDHAFGHFSSHSVYINVLPPLSSPKIVEDTARVGASRLGASQSDHVIVPNSQDRHPKPVAKEPCTSASGSSSLCLHTSTSNDDDKQKPTSQHYPLRQRESANAVDTNCPPYVEEADANDRFIWRSKIKIKVMNRTHAAIEGGPAMLTAHVCGADVGAHQVTWFPPSKKTPLTPGHSYGRWTPFNLSSVDSQQCVLSNLHIVPVVGEKDEGAWVILVMNVLTAHAAVVQLNVSTAAKSLATADIYAATPAMASSSHRANLFILFISLVSLACNARSTTRHYFLLE